MVDIIKQRMTAEVKGDVVVFLIGLRINKLWKIHKWWPVAMAMPRMINELYKNPDLGFISHEQWAGRTTIMVQYWKSFEHLENYAKNRTSSHLPAWADFNKKIGSNGDVGIWHETYLSKQGSCESVYNNMPMFGLAKATNCVPATGKYQSASDRIKHRNN
ncbi:MAG: transcriptional regulator [SAR86 cluster bacterium]|uniref:Transcriptional regulator n=1 Tax=SAR86 cluster bacterium TaxID=2030880 RepID=A0A2A4MPQ2_9GAMM|nr:MAG: transcriptional regulator [SAR86 cluster bacterium]